MLHKFNGLRLLEFPEKGHSYYISLKVSRLRRTFEGQVSTCLRLKESNQSRTGQQKFLRMVDNSAINDNFSKDKQSKCPSMKI